MTLTELALLRLLPSTTADHASLKAKLANAKAVMEKYTGRTFYILQQIEDPIFLYVIGEWESLKQHMDGFIPSAENQALLEELKNDLTVEWMFHVDAPHAALPLPTLKKSGDGSQAGSHVLSIGRLFIKADDKDKFQETFDTNKHYLQVYLTEGSVGGGWRFDKDDGKEEFAIITPWTDVEQHLSFAKTEDFEKYAQIKPFLDGAEIKHAKLMDL